MRRRLRVRAQILIASVLLGSCLCGPIGPLCGPICPQASDRGASASLSARVFAGSGDAGFADGPDGRLPQFSAPHGLAFDSQGNLYVADTGNNSIRKIDPAGNVTTIAGNPQAGDTDGTGGFNGTGLFRAPIGLAVDSVGNVYVADTGNNQVRMVDPYGNVATIAGNGRPGFVDGTGGPDGTAEFDEPRAIAVGTKGLYVADYKNSAIRKIDWKGNVTTLARGFTDTGVINDAGSGDAGTDDAGTDDAGTDDAGSGDAGTDAGSTEVLGPTGLTLAGAMYIVLSDNTVLTMTTNDQVRTLPPVWPGLCGHPSAPLSVDPASSPTIASDAAGNLYVTDSADSLVRQFPRNSNLETDYRLSVTLDRVSATNAPDGGAVDSYPVPTISTPGGVAVDAEGRIYVSDLASNTVRVTTSTFAQEPDGGQDAGGADAGHDGGPDAGEQTDGGQDGG